VFDTCGTSEPDDALVPLSCFLASEIHVVVFEKLVDAILEHALVGVDNESGAKTFLDTLWSLHPQQGSLGH
jgi:hypothetical protein